MPEREQRRLTTILAADVAGYSRLMGADEEGTMRRMRSLRAELIDSAIQTNHGRIVKTTGDGILIEFASVVDAVRCAIDVQRAMTRHNTDFVSEKRIEFRVGIHLGDVMVEDDGDLMGDGVNIAARLESIAEPGGICLSRAAYEQVEGKIDSVFTDLGDKELKNIARPVRVFSIDPVQSTTTRRGKEQSANPTTASSSPPRLSIVVLPFANIGGDPEQEYFVDGVTESLTTDLSRIRNSFVIGRHTAFSYKGKPVDLKQVGRELGVRYVLEGSVQRSGKRIRVNVQLIDAESGAHLWAERFDRDYGDLFEMQDEIVARLANSLNAQFIAAEARRAERTLNPDAMDLYFRGMAAYNRGLNPATFAEARGLFQQALALDPNNVEALSWLALLLALVAATVTSDQPRAALVTAAEEAANKALVLAPEDSFVHAVLGNIYGITRRPEAAIVEAERALQLNPSNIVAYGALVGAKLFAGRAAEVEDPVMHAVRLSPRDTYLYVFYAAAGIAKSHLGKDEEAAVWFKRSIDANHFFPNAHWWMAATLANLNRIAEAREEIKTTLALDPTFSIRRVIAYLSASENPTALAEFEHLIEGLRKAEVPEG